MPRISWGHGESRLLTCAGDRARITTLAGTLVRELEPRPITLGLAPNVGQPGATLLAGYHDARFLSDGRIVAVDVFGRGMVLSMQGEPYDELGQPPNPWRVRYASICDDGLSYVALGYQIEVRSIQTQQVLWSYSSDSYTAPFQIDRFPAVAALARDGSKIAIGIAPPATDDAPARRGWVVLDASPVPRGPRRPGPPPLDDYTFPADGAIAPLALALDPSGTRLAVASGCPRGSGAIRIGAMSRAPEAIGVATVVAFDAMGIRVAYGLPEAERRVRVDYLSTTRPGPRAVEILDSRAIDPGFAPIALAFDPEGHRIACLGEDGAVEIVPVP